MSIVAGDGVSLLYASIILVVLAWLIMFARAGIRIWRDSFGMDDYLMLAGVLIFTVTCNLCTVCSFYGSGQKAAVLSTHDIMKGTKLFFIAEFFYASGAVLIKCSIAVTLLRVADCRRRFVYSIWVIIALTVISAIIFMITIANICHPITTLWLGTGGTCNLTLDSDISIFFSAVEITTDWSLAILPALLLWKIQMKVRVKASVALILGLGAFASCATIVRLRFLSLYSDPTEFMYSTGKIGLWSIIECGIGIFAGSLPALRPILSLPCFGRGGSTDDSEPAASGNEYKAPPKPKRKIKMAYEIGLTTFQPLEDEAGVPDREGGDRDGDSQKHILKETQVTVVTNDRSDSPGAWERGQVLGWKGNYNNGAS